jgi:hypothetical protein
MLTPEAFFMDDWRSRISVDPKVLVGKPVIKGTRIAVELSSGYWRAVTRSRPCSASTSTSREATS